MAETAVATVPEATEITAERQTLAQRATDLVVNEKTYPLAAQLRSAIKALEKKVEETFDGPIDAANKAHKAILAAKKQHMDPLVAAETIVNRKLGDYDQEQEAKREVERRRLEAEARRQEEEARLAAAAELEAEGQTEAAEALIEEPIEVAPVYVPPAVPKVDGLSFRTDWKFKVIDLPALILSVARGDTPKAALKADEVFIGAQVRSLKEAFDMPGVKKWSVKKPIGK